MWLPGNLATIATRYVPSAYFPSESTVLNMKSIRLKTKELQGNTVEASGLAISQFHDFEI